MESDLSVGVVGVGHMGAGMARNLVDAGLPVVVNDVDDERVADLVEYGATSRGTPGAVAEEVDVVISSLPTADHVRTVALGDGGLVTATGAEFVYVDVSTIGHAAIREVAAELERPGVQVIDAPVSGGQDGAEAGELRFMVGCDGPIPDECERIFDVLGVNVVHVGDLGAGQVAKVLNNMVSAASIVSLCEAFVFAEKAGIEKGKIAEAMDGSTGDTWVLQNRASELIDREFEPGFRGAYLYKDLRIATEGAEEYGVPLPIGSTSHELYKSLVEMDRGDLSASAIVTVLEDLAGLEKGVADEPETRSDQ